MQARSEVEEKAINLIMYDQ
jgi:hypothetical protein